MKNSKFDHIRAVACMMVILLHTAGSSVAVFDGYFNWYHALCVSSFTRACVPLFVMLSGVLFILKEEEIFNFYKKRLTRVLIPFFLWAGIFFLFKFFYLHKSFSPAAIVSEIISGPVYYHFWYLYMIIGLYLFIPFFLPWLRKAANTELILFILIWQIFQNGYLLYHMRFGLNPGFGLINFSGFAGYLVTGVFIFKNATKLSSFHFSLIALTGIALTFVIAFYFSVHSPFLVFNDYLMLPTFISAFGFFGFFLKSEIPKFISIFFSLISKYSFGIYFFHVIPLKLLLDNHLLTLNGSGIGGILFFWLICMLVSLAVILLLSKIPVAGKYLS